MERLRALHNYCEVKMVIRSAKAKFKDETIKIHLNGSILLEERGKFSKAVLERALRKQIKPEIFMERFDVVGVNDDDLGVEVDIIIDLNSPISLDKDFLDPLEDRPDGSSY